MTETMTVRDDEAGISHGRMVVSFVFLYIQTHKYTDIYLHKHTHALGRSAIDRIVETSIQFCRLLTSFWFSILGCSLVCLDYRYDSREHTGERVTNGTRNSRGLFFSVGIFLVRFVKTSCKLTKACQYVSLQLRKLQRKKMTNPGPENDLVNERLRDVDESFLVVILISSLMKGWSIFPKYVL